MNGYLGRRLGAKQPENMGELTPKLIQKIVENLNLIEKLTLRIRGFLFIDNIKFEGWSKELPLYLFKCELHGYELSYPQGYYLKLICLDCFRKQMEDMPNPPKMIYKKYLKRKKEEESNTAIPAEAHTENSFE